MTPENMRTLSAFLAVSSGTLLVSLALGRYFGRPRTRGGDLVDPELDPIPGSASPKAPATKPVRISLAAPRVGGGGPGLGVPIAFVAAVLLFGGFWHVARGLVRQQFERVIGKVATDNRFGIDFDTSRLKGPDLRGLTFPGGQFSPRGL